MTVISFNIPSLNFVSHKGEKMKVIIDSEMNFHMWIHHTLTSPLQPAKTLLSFFCFFPKHARSIPQGPCDALGGGETQMNTGSIQSTLSIHMFMR